jgi:membrane protein implicated in regulation of membrane protease activity
LIPAVDNIFFFFFLCVISAFKERKFRNRVREQSRKRERKEEERGRRERERERIKEERGDVAPLYLNNTLNAAMRRGPAQ